MKKPNEFSCIMGENNLKEVKRELEINNSLFNPNSCVYDEKGIYWSIIDFSPDTINVNGCGEEYTYTRQQVENNNLYEFIKMKR